MAYSPGEMITLSVAFTDGAGAPKDPTDVTLYLKPPGQAVVTVPLASLTHGGTGAYSYDYTIPLSVGSAGNWAWRWWGTGAVVRASEGSFEVGASEFVT